jgi:hypothetical protein
MPHLNKRIFTHGDRGDTAAKIAHLRTLPETPDIPEGVDINTPREKLLWKQFTQARQTDAWRIGELVILGRVVKLHIKIENTQKQLDELGEVLVDDKGNLRQNPYLAVLTAYVNEYKSLITKLRITVASAEALEDAKFNGNMQQRANAATALPLIAS